MPKKFKKKSIPEYAHPLVQSIFAEMNSQKLTYNQLAERSTVKAKVFERWRGGVLPQLQTLEMVLEALNLDLKVERRHD